jgi:hypothetical protein
LGEQCPSLVLVSSYDTFTKIKELKHVFNNLFHKYNEINEIYTTNFITQVGLYKCNSIFSKYMVGVELLTYSHIFLGGNILQPPKR